MRNFRGDLCLNFPVGLRSDFTSDRGPADSGPSNRWSGLEPWAAPSSNGESPNAKLSLSKRGSSGSADPQFWGSAALSPARPQTPDFKVGGAALLAQDSVIAVQQRTTAALSLSKA